MSMYQMATKQVEILNHKFGALTVIKKCDTDKNGNRVWLCKCDCGNHKKAVQYHLLSGRTHHCGDRSIHKFYNKKEPSKKKKRLELIGILARIKQKEKIAKEENVRYRHSNSSALWNGREAHDWDKQLAELQMSIEQMDEILNRKG